MKITPELIFSELAGASFMQSARDIIPEWMFEVSYSWSFKMGNCDGRDSITLHILHQDSRRNDREPRLRSLEFTRKSGAWKVGFEGMIKTAFAKIRADPSD